MDGSLNWVKFETGEALNYLTFIESEVIPFVETHYRATPDHRTLAGQSLGGSFGVLTLLTKPQLFENYILTSPSLWIHDSYLFELEKQFAAKNTELKAKIYFATGAMETPANGSKNDMVGLQNAFVAKLRSRNYSSLEVKDDIIEGAYHETTFPIGFTKGALWLYGMSSPKQ
ncbi:alpha/beta hydrolase [Shewanella baltica]|uniref:alpha/beta hydrolase n=1 Tax=Shewanella baltica TaxID=62322 RepID=UPI0039853F77